MQRRTLSQKNICKGAQINRFDSEQYWNSLPLPGPKNPASAFRSAIFLDSPTTSKQLGTGTAHQRFTHVETLQDLLFVIRGVLPVLISWGKKERGLYLITLEKMIAETKPIREKTFSTFNYAYELPDFTSILEQFAQNELPIPRILMFHGLKAAACGNSPTTMRHYLSLYRPQFQNISYRLDAKQWDMIVNCILVTTRSPPRQSEKTLRQKKVWAEVVIHEVVGTLIRMNSNQRRQQLGRASFFMYPILINFGYHGISNYFRLVSRFYESQAVFEQGMNYLVLGLYDRNLRPEALNFIFNSYIQILLAKNSPEQAWKLAQEALPKFGTVQGKTWKLLLRNPEVPAKWKPGMEKPVLDALERYMSKAERRLGVKWTGGEDGFHMPRGEGDSPRLIRHPEYPTNLKSGMEEPVMDTLERYMSKAERYLDVNWTGGEDGFHVPRPKGRKTRSAVKVLATVPTFASCQSRMTIAIKSRDLLQALS